MSDEKDFLETYNCMFNPYKSLELEKYIKKNSDFLETTLNYGINLLDLINRNHKNSHGDASILFLFKDLLENLDGIKVLYDSSCVNASVPLIRTSLEVYLQLVYILIKDTKRRALAYNVGHTHSKIELYKKVIREKNIKSNNLKYNEAKQMIENLESHLKTEELKPIELEYKRLKRLGSNNRKYPKYPKWYSYFDGPKNIRELTDLVDNERTYKYFYNILSKRAHGEGAYDNLINYDGKAKIRAIRNVSNMNHYSDIVFSMISIVYMLISSYYLPKEEYVVVDWVHYMREKLDKL